MTWFSFRGHPNPLSQLFILIYILRFCGIPFALRLIRFLYFCNWCDSNVMQLLMKKCVLLQTASKYVARMGSKVQNSLSIGIALSKCPFGSWYSFSSLTIVSMTRYIRLLIPSVSCIKFMTRLAICLLVQLAQVQRHIHGSRFIPKYVNPKAANDCSCWKDPDHLVVESGHEFVLMHRCHSWKAVQMFN